LKIKLATKENLGKFFIYLADHLSDNWKDGTHIFLPMSKNESQLDSAMKAHFSNGIDVNIGEPGWRRIFLAFDEK